MRLSKRRDATRDVDAGYDEHAVVVSSAEHEAAGVKAVMVSLQRGLESMGALRTAAAASSPSSARTAPRPSPRRPPSGSSRPRSFTPVSKAIVIRLERA